MKHTKKETKRIIDKVRSGKPLTDTEKEYLGQVADKATRELPDSIGSWILKGIIDYVDAGRRQTKKQIDEVLDKLFEDGS